MLKDLLQEASQEPYALGHFNFSTLGIFRAIVQACTEVQSPVFVGTSEGEAKYVGYAAAAALVTAFRADTGLPIFLNADHHKTFESAKMAIDAGYDSVQIDETALTLEENTEVSKKVVEYAQSVMRFLVQLSTRVLIMHHGEKIYEGLPDGLSQNEKVADVYLGKGTAQRIAHFLQETG